jgi:COP9 signalosome complex subunit 3
MDKVVGMIMSLSSNETDLKSLKQSLQKSEEVLYKSQHLDEAIGQLDFVVFSMGVTFLLAAKATITRIPDAPRFLGQCARFLTDANPEQVRMVAPKFGRIAHRFLEVAVDLKQPMRAIQPLRVAIAKMRASPEQLTPIHADFVQACLCAKNYKAALPVLEDELFDLDPSATGISPREVMRYYYYGGMIYSGLKEYRKALEFFKMVFTMPAMTLSAIMVEAYKKYVLVSLLVHGQLVPMPKHTSSVVQRSLKTLCSQYSEIGTAYSTNSTDEVHKVATTHSGLFDKDKNFGLVKQVIQSLYRRNIQRATQTYLTISLADIAETVKLSNPPQPPSKEAEKRIVRMIESGEVFAQISHATGMVSFQEAPERYDTNRTVAQLDVNIHKLMSLGAKLRRADEAIAVSTAYLQKTTASERGRWEGAEDVLEAGTQGMNK